MGLAIFDLDNTLLGGDSDYLWGQFLVEQGIVERDHYEQENERFFQAYQAGTLDIAEFLQFSLKPLSEHSLDRLLRWREQFMAEKIAGIALPKAHALIDRHRAQGHHLLIITATNSFVTRPIADELGIVDLIATEPEISNGRYTGQVAGVPCFREGKVQRLEQWLQDQGQNLATSWFYSDSHNDLPLLELVTHPTAVDPDDTLAQHAEMKGWPILSLR